MNFIITYYCYCFSRIAGAEQQELSVFVCGGAIQHTCRLAEFEVGFYLYCSLAIRGPCTIEFYSFIAFTQHMLGHGVVNPYSNVCGVKMLFSVLHSASQTLVSPTFPAFLGAQVPRA